MSNTITMGTFRLEARCPWQHCRKRLQLYGASWSDKSGDERMTLHYRCVVCNSTITATPRRAIARRFFERAEDLPDLAS